MAEDWVVASEAPAQVDPWQPVNEAPLKPQGRGILQALKDYPAHFAQGLLDTVKYPGEVLKSETPTTSEGLVESGQPVGLALMGGLKLSPKVGGVKPSAAEGPTISIRPTPEAMRTEPAPEWKPVSEEPTSGIEANAPVQLAKTGRDRYTIHDAEGKPIAHANIGIVEIDGKKLAQIDDIYTPELEGVKTQAEHDAAVTAARNIMGTSQMRNAMRQFLEMHPEVEGFTGNRTSGARNAGKMNADNIQNITVGVNRAKELNGAEPIAPTPAYVYHATSPQNADAISKKGLIPKGSGTYFAPNERMLSAWKNEGDSIYRVDRSRVEDLRSETGGLQSAETDSLYTNSKVHPSDLEVSNDGGKTWSPIEADLNKPKIEALEAAVETPKPTPEQVKTSDNAARMKPEVPIEGAPVPEPKTPQGLADDLQVLRQSSVADRAEVGNKIKALPEVARDPKLGERLYHAAEDPAEFAKLSPEEQVISEQHLKPLREEQAALAQRAKELGGADLVEDPNYIHRIAKGHAPAYDSLSGDAYDPVAGTRGLPRSTSAMQNRKYFAIENEAGVRKVVSASPDGVTVWNGKKGTNISGEHDLVPGSEVELGGKPWKVTQARTKEIEQHTPTEYHKNAFVNTADAVVRLREVVRNLEFVRDVQASPWWLEHATKAGGNREIPKGWVRPKMPQFSDWYVDPKYAHVLDDFYKPGFLDAESSLRRANQFATSSMFWNPIGHMQNVGVHWSVARGWDWVRPGPWRHFATDMTRALKETVTQGPEYQKWLREGGGLVYGGVKNADFYGDIGRHLGMDIEKNWGSWKPLFNKLGLKTPYEATAWWYSKMRNVLWATSDMFMMHRYLELERKGLPVRKALHEAEKHIPNYRIPTTIMGSREFSKIAQEPAFTVFSRYHYGMWKSFMHMATDLAKGTPKEKLEALGNVAALAAMGYVVYPVLDAIYQKITDDPKAKMLARGAMSVPRAAKEWWNNDISFSQFLGNQITAAPATKEVLQQFFGKDFFTGKSLDGTVPRVQHAAKALVSPYGTVDQTTSGGRSAGRAVLDTIVGGQNTSEKTERGKAYGKRLREKDARMHELKPKGLIEQGYYSAKEYATKKLYGGPQ